MTGERPADPEGPALLAFLEAQRDVVLSIVAGLDEAAWHRPGWPSTWAALVPGGRGRLRYRAALR